MQNAQIKTIVHRPTCLDLWDRVKGYRSPAAIHHYAKECNVTPALAEEHFIELLKYLCLSASSTTNVTPSDLLDQVWHSFIIQTREYARFSELLGTFVHHSTMSGPQFGAFRAGLSLYREYFGQPHAVWSTPRIVKNPDCPECDIVGWCSDNDKGNG